MSSATLPDRQLDPFRIQQEEDVEDEPEVVVIEPEASQKPIDPQSLGMVLTSTLIGSGRSLVKIDGKTYVFKSAKNEKPIVVHNSDDTEYQFRIVGVAPGYVQLEHDGQIHELKIKQATLADSERIQFHGSGMNPSSPNG